MASTTRPAPSADVTRDRTGRVRADPASTRGMDRRWALLAMALGFGVVQLDVTAVNVAIRPITAGFGGSVAGGQWVVNAYTLALASLLLSAGALGDRVGAKRVFVAGFGLFTLASAACGFAPTLGVLIGARTVQGIGAAALIPCSLTLLHHTYPDSIERGRAVGLWAACASIALSAGPLIGGVLIQVLDWRAIFYINAPLGLLGILLTLRNAAETPRTSRPLDLPGQILAIVVLAALAAALIAGGRTGFTNPLVVSGLGVAILGVSVFVWVEARSREPMLPLGLFRSRTFAATVSIGLMINIVFYGLIFVLSLYFQSVRGYSVLATGAAFVPTTAGVFAGNLLAGRFVRQAGPRLVLTISAMLTAVSLAALLGAGDSTGFVTVLGPLVTLGFGLGVLVPSMTSALLGSVETTRSGLASGALNTARQAGSVIGVALFGALANGHLIDGLRLSLIVSIALAVLTVAVSWLSARRPTNDRSLRTTRIAVWSPSLAFVNVDSHAAPSGIRQLTGGDPRYGPLPPLLLALTVVTGLVDAVSILQLGRVFVANMTGNVVFTGFAIAGAPGFSLSASLFALFGFLAGAMIGGALIGRLGQDRALLLGGGAGLELVLVICACVITAVGSTPFTSTVRNITAALLAIGMGVQNAVTRRLAVPDLTTTVLTMTLTGIAADVRSGTNRAVMLRRLASVAAMLGGGVLGAVLVLHTSAAITLGVTAGVILIVAGGAGLAIRRPGAWRKVPT